MTPQQAQQALPILEAYAAGKTVQVRLKEAGVQTLHCGGLARLQRRSWSDFADSQLTYFGLRIAFVGDPYNGLLEWRIKPTTKKVWWRVYKTFGLDQQEAVKVHTITGGATPGPEHQPKDFFFSGWLTDWQCVEVEG